MVIFWTLLKVYANRLRRLQPFESEDLEELAEIAMTIVLTMPDVMKNAVLVDFVVQEKIKCPIVIAQQVNFPLHRIIQKYYIVYLQFIIYI